jgi:hypothetical protein
MPPLAHFPSRNQYAPQMAFYLRRFTQSVKAAGFGLGSTQETPGFSHPTLPQPLALLRDFSNL